MLCLVSGQVSVTVTDPGERRAVLAGPPEVVPSGDWESSRPGSDPALGCGWAGCIPLGARMSSSVECRPIANIPAVRFGRRRRESRQPAVAPQRETGLLTQTERRCVWGRASGSCPRRTRSPRPGLAQSCASGLLALQEPPLRPTGFSGATTQTDQPGEEFQLEFINIFLEDLL